MKRAFSSLAAVVLVGAMARAAMAQTSNGISQGEHYGPGFPNAAPVGQFDNGYLDHHPEVARQLGHNPGLADNPQFLATHPGLDSYLATHPQVRTELQQHPDRFMNAERRYEGQENGHAFPNAAPVGQFDNGYLDHHPEVARQLGHNPGLADNPQFLATHPGLDSYLATHPQVRTELQQHPDRFMNAERRYEGQENGHAFPNAAPVARFDNGYLDHHPEVARQLGHNPGLADNPQFLATHPGLDSYLATHPQVRTELQQHPDRFMNAERRYEHYENRVKAHDSRRSEPIKVVRRANNHPR